jgi:hypothetical protein
LNNLATLGGNDIHDGYQTPDLFYNTSNVVNCTSTSSTIKFYLSNTGFIYDCLLPSSPLLSCGVGDIYVDGINGRNHQLCGTDAQPCQSLYWGISVSNGGRIILMSTKSEFSIMSNKTENKTFKVINQHDSYRGIVISNFSSLDGYLLDLGVDTDVEFDNIDFRYHRSQISVFNGVFFKTTHATASLGINNAYFLANDINHGINETFILNEGGKVVLNRCTFSGISTISSHPAFHYIVTNSQSSFIHF